MSWIQQSLCWVLLVVWWCGAASSSNSCLLNDEELMKQRRIQTLRNSIMAQLGVSDPAPEGGDEPLPDEEEMKETFHALRSASASLEREKEQRCHSDDFYAKPVSSFVGIMSEGVLIARVVASCRRGRRKEVSEFACQHVCCRL